jgi:hypothetical protein
MGSIGRGQWRIAARSTEQLARILEVSTAAIAKTQQSGRIAREPDGIWSVLDVVNAWRATVRPYLQRDPSPWIDPREELDVTMLIRRARYAGARIELRCEGDTEWREVPDPVQRINRGDDDFDIEGSAVDCLSLQELNGLVPEAGFWVGIGSMLARGGAKVAGITEKQAQVAIDAAIAIALLMRVAFVEEEWFGPATAQEMRNGRIPLSALTSGEKKAAERRTVGQRRSARRAA